MTGTEFGIFSAALGASLTAIAAVVRERWKGKNDQRLIAMQADAQESEQSANLVPAYKDLVANLMARLEIMEAKLDVQGQTIQDQAIKSGLLEQGQTALEERVKTLTTHGESDALTISSLRHELERCQDELEEAQSEIIALRNRIRELEMLREGRSEPDYSSQRDASNIPKTTARITQLANDAGEILTEALTEAHEENLKGQQP